MTPDDPLIEDWIARCTARPARRAVLEADADGNPARRGEVVAIDPAPGLIDKARAAGFTLLRQEREQRNRRRKGKPCAYCRERSCPLPGTTASRSCTEAVRLQARHMPRRIQSRHSQPSATRAIRV